jgi:chromosome segregation protein
VQSSADAEAALIAADDARGDAQAREADARAQRSEAEGELSALSAESAALARLVDRDTAEGGQVLDLLRVQSGYEKALGAALSDDLRAPAIEPDAGRVGRGFPAIRSPQTLPEGVRALTDLRFGSRGSRLRRMSQVGLVDRADGTRLQPELKPGQRLVSIEGDLWRWDGFRARAEDAPSAAALRLQQLNRLEELKQEIEGVNRPRRGAARAHEVLKTRLADTTAADAAARDARRKADQAVTEAGPHAFPGRGRARHFRRTARKPPSCCRPARRSGAEARGALRAQSARSRISRISTLPAPKPRM